MKYRIQFIVSYQLGEYFTVVYRIRDCIPLLVEPRPAYIPICCSVWNHNLLTYQNTAHCWIMTCLHSKILLLVESWPAYIPICHSLLSPDLWHPNTPLHRCEAPVPVLHTPLISGPLERGVRALQLSLWRWCLNTESGKGLHNLSQVGACPLLGLDSLNVN